MSEGERVGRMGRNALFNAFRSVIGALVAFATSIVIARALGPTQTGVYTLVIWVALATTLIVSEGLALTITKSVAQHNVRTQREAIIRIVAFGIRTQLVVAAIGASALALASGFLADAFNAPGAERLFGLAAFLVFFGALIEMFSAPILGLERHGLLVPLKTVWVIAWLVSVTVVLIVLDAELEALMAVLAVIWLLVTVLHVAVLSRVVTLRRTSAISAGSRRRIARTAIALSVSSTLGLVVFKRSEVFLLGYFSVPSDVAFYSIAYAMADALQYILPMALAFAIFPNITRAFAARDFEFARRAYEGQLRLTALAIAPVAVAGALLSDPVINILYGRAFGAAALPLAVLLFSAGVNRLGYCAFGALVGSDRERLVVWITAGSAVANLSFGLALIPTFGVAGAAAAEASTQLLFAAASIFVVWRAVGFGFPVAGFLRILAANLPVLLSVGLVVRLVDSDLAKVVVGIAAVAPAYAFGLFVTRALSPWEKRYLRQRFASLHSI
ncbi:MAG: oligosaccharide flippase family protein [Actinobacteria bacterium]|nr:oligosaccharide flippase family protein [Actinomycetota bacterium]